MSFKNSASLTTTLTCILVKVKPVLYYHMHTHLEVKQFISGLHRSKSATTIKFSPSLHQSHPRIAKTPLKPPIMGTAVIERVYQRFYSFNRFIYFRFVYQSVLSVFLLLCYTVMVTISFSHLLKSMFSTIKLLNTFVFYII